MAHQLCEHCPSGPENFPGPKDRPVTSSTTSNLAHNSTQPTTGLVLLTPRTPTDTAVLGPLGSALTPAPCGTPTGFTKHASPNGSVKPVEGDVPLPGVENLPSPPTKRKSSTNSRHSGELQKKSKPGKISLLETGDTPVSPETCSSCHVQSKRLSSLSGIPLCPTCTFLFTTSPRKLRSRGQRNKPVVSRPPTSPSAVVSTATPGQSPSALVVHTAAQTQVCLDDPLPMLTPILAQVKKKKDMKKMSTRHSGKKSSEEINHPETKLPSLAGSTSRLNSPQLSPVRAHSMKVPLTSENRPTVGTQDDATFPPASPSVRPICESCTKPCPLRQKLQTIGKLRICPACVPLFTGSQVTTRRSRRPRPSQSPAIPTSVPTVKSPGSSVGGKSTCSPPPLSLVSEPLTPSETDVPSGNSNPAGVTKSDYTEQRTKRIQSHTPDVAYVTTGAFLTRNALKRLTEESHGFVEEFHNFRPFQQVRVLQSDRQWYPAELLTIRDGKVQVKFIDQSTWPSQWLPVDSRRLLSEEAYLASNPTPSVPQTNLTTPNLKVPLEENRKNPIVSKIPPSSVELVGQAPIHSPGKLCHNDPDHEIPTQFELPENGSPCGVTAEPLTLSRVSQFGSRLIYNTFHNAIMLMERQGIVLNGYGASREGIDDGNFDKAATKRFFNLNLQSFVALPPFQDLSDYAVCYKIDAYVRVRDQVNQWSNARVVAIDREKFTVSIRYAGFSTSTQETLPMNSNRVRVTLKDILTVWQTSHQKYSDLPPPTATPESCSSSPTQPLPTTGDPMEVHEVSITSPNHSLKNGEMAAAKKSDSGPPSIACDVPSTTSAPFSDTGNHYSQRQGRLWSALFNFKQSKDTVRPLPNLSSQKCQGVASFSTKVTQPFQSTSAPVSESGRVGIGPIPHSSLSALLQQEMALLRHNETVTSMSRAVILQNLLENGGPAGRTKSSDNIHPNDGSPYTLGETLEFRITRKRWVLATVVDIKSRRMLVRTTQPEPSGTHSEEWLRYSTRRLRKISESELRDRPPPRGRGRPRKSVAKLEHPVTHEEVSNRPNHENSTFNQTSVDADSSSKQMINQVTIIRKDGIINGQRVERITKARGTKKTQGDQGSPKKSHPAPRLVVVEDGQVEYIVPETSLVSKGKSVGSSSAGEADSSGEYTEFWTIYCNACQRIIKQVRFYCTYCESPSEGFDYDSFELCLYCFEHQFPTHHEHPKSSFAMQWLLSPTQGAQSSGNDAPSDPVHSEDTIPNTTSHSRLKPEELGQTGELVQSFERDEFDKTYRGKQVGATPEKAPASDNAASLEYYLQYMNRMVCAFCLDDEFTGSLAGEFIGPHPFKYPVKSRQGITKYRTFWAHDACARYSPEVVVVDGVWYNVTTALRRGRTIKCVVCRERGATIGCFHSKCNRSYHLKCTSKPLSYFREGVIFWCPQHESDLFARDQYEDVFSCDQCSKSLVEEKSWFTCSLCSEDYFSSFDLCEACYPAFPADRHPHGTELFRKTTWELIAEDRRTRERAQPGAKRRGRGGGGKVASGTIAGSRDGPGPDKSKKGITLSTLDVDSLTDIQCSYCPNYLAPGWRRGFGGMLVCKDCYELTLSQLKPGALTTPNERGLVSSAGLSENTNGEVLEPGLVQDEALLMQYSAHIEDYSFATYLTRGSLLESTGSHYLSEVKELDSLGPTKEQEFSLVTDSTYYDILGRAPRWATHSGTDYHGTWLPQTVRRALLRFTRPQERILSNFLGRGTDAIESLLLRRRCVGIDINPLAVERSKRNCSFRVPHDSGITAEHRPIILLGDARNLVGPGFEDESFDHVLSHPPYKNCVLYSRHIEGDLSRFPGSDQFIQEMDRVIQQTRRLLKMERRVTLGIGDNRKDCYYIPVGFHLFRQYLKRGFVMEELILKRQRYCQAFGLGTELCTRFDFLMFTHEFIVTFRKVPMSDSRTFPLGEIDWLNTFAQDRQLYLSAPFRLTRSTRTIPLSPIVRTSRPMGTVWTFKPTALFTLGMLSLSRIVERFGTDGTNWEEINISLDSETQGEEDNIANVSPSLSGANSKSSPPASAVTNLNLDQSQKHEPETEPKPDLLSVAAVSPANTLLSPSGLAATSASSAVGKSNPEEETDPGVSCYEQERLRKIQRNKKALMSMGLVSDLNDDVADDIPHYELMTSMPCLDSQAPLWLVAIPHIPNTQLRPAYIAPYRRIIMQLALGALDRLNESGVFAVGAQDYRCRTSGEFWPMGLLVFEDVVQAMKAQTSGWTLRLKELMIAVPDGYYKDRKNATPSHRHLEPCVLDLPSLPHLPIVHAYYLIFRKVKQV
ncbi:hypothetical protein IWQ61_004288 [Dispira simplex]|nr:hypothetical protein IWQ61_004288 [Dispira simplex]